MGGLGRCGGLRGGEGGVIGGWDTDICLLFTFLLEN